MICRQCLRRASALRPPSRIARSISNSTTPPTPASTTSINAAPEFSNPLAGTKARPKSRAVALPVSSAPAGTPLKGINYLKNAEDPIALEEHEYPEWLWRCLDLKNGENANSDNVHDEFSKSKKVRRKAAKAQRKLEERMRLSGEVIEPKIPITKQSIDLPANETGTVEGGLAAELARRELRSGMRRERRSSIKEGNFLKSM